MKSFKKFITEGAGHLMHIEDLILYGGVEGTRNAIATLRSVRDMLAGHSAKHIHATTKYDGAPAIFCGIDPSDKKFFVAKKSIFNSTPVVYKTHSDIDVDTTGDLANKLHVALDELAKLGIKGIIQGDIMFTDDTVRPQVIDGTQYLTFHPNTIVYAVPVGTPLADKIKSSKIGVVFHTSYSGKLGALQASPGVNTSSMKQVSSVWWQTADVQDLSGTATMTEDETAEVTSILSQAGRTFQQISGTVLNQIEKDQDLARDLETYNNSKVRKGKSIGNPKSHVKGLIDWMTKKFAKESAEKKTEKGRAAVDARAQARMSFFSPGNIGNLVLIYDLQNSLIQAKGLLIDKLNTLGGISTFLKTKKGYEVTSQEGYVIADHLTGDTVKLVDRLEFSYANFSSDVIHGWY